MVRSGDPLEALQKLVQEIEVHAIYAEEDYSPYARSRDARISSILPLEIVQGVTVHHPESLKKADGGVYRVFTPFSRLWRELPLAGKPATVLPGLFPPVPQVESLPIPQFQPSDDFPAGEQEAQKRLKYFLSEGVFHYDQDRNRMDLEGTSQLSPYFRFGMLSARQAVYEVIQLIYSNRECNSLKDCQTWLNELIWREFYYSILYHFPNVQNEAFQEKMRGIIWRQSNRDLQKWKDGQTGYPVVDAAMRQLSQTGWMHNRARMVTASFLVKDLLINWQEGERWFMENLVDGDPASNNGGWQWTAGVGTDAAPYFRIFNPVSQGKKFDPLGDYVRKYIPELESVPQQFIHEPWLMPLDLQEAAGVIIGRDYPEPVVDHAGARDRTLAAYKANS